jgi:hypothetical protein
VHGIKSQALFKIQNYKRIEESDATQMSEVTPTIMDFRRIALNFISYFFTVCNAISSGIDISFL